MSQSSIPITEGSTTAIATRLNASGQHMQVVVLGNDGSDETTSGLQLLSVLQDIETAAANALAAWSSS